MESAEVQLLLRRALFPKLQLTSLQALRCTSTTLRASVDELKNEVWLTVARYGRTQSGFAASRTSCRHV